MRVSAPTWYKFSFLQILLVGLGFTAVSSWAGEKQHPDPGELSAIVSRAHDLVQKDAVKVPGLSVAVAMDGKIVWSEGFGYADLEAKKAVVPTTRFRIGSVSKPLTAAGLVLLVQRGQLDLDAPVQKYVADFPVKPEGVITTRLAAGHLAGIRHYRGSETHLNRSFATIREGLKVFEDDPVLSPPGARYNYSTYGWSLVSAVMESAAHRDFLEYMDAEVFKPLGMEHTRPDRAGVADPDRTRFYKKEADGKFVETEPINSSYKWAGGGFLSTAADLVRFGSALLREGYLDEESLRLLFTSQKTTDGKPTGYGIGWFVRKDKEGRPFYYHTGGQQGSTALIFLQPHNHLVVALVCNLSDADIIGEGKEITDLFTASVAGPTATK
jgi:serine beta-lactamase-like protein LACTB, mitochondrial